MFYGTHLHRPATGAAVRPRQQWWPPFGGASAGQQIVEQRRRSGADESMERGDGEHTQLVERVFGRSRHVGEQRLEEKSFKIKFSLYKLRFDNARYMNIMVMNVKTRTLGKRVRNGCKLCMALCN